MSDEIKWTKEQLQAIQEIGNILISASAGSGKTTVLVERVLNNIINRHIPINRMLILTFTDLASQDMKEKITKKLIEKAKEGGENSKLLKEQISLIPFSQISTLHSFCMEIARSYFDYLNINPTFDIISDMDQSLYMVKAFNNVIDSLDGDEKSEIDLRLLLDVLTDSRTLDEFYSIVLKIYNNTETQVNKQYLATQVYELFKTEGINKLEEIVKNGYEQLINDCYCMLENLLNFATINADYVNNFLDCLEPLRKSASLRELVSYAEKYLLTGIIKSAKGKEEEFVQERLTKLRAKVKKIIDKILLLSPYDNQLEILNKTRPVLENLVLFTNEFMKEYTRLKEKDNKLDFNDLETYALKVLENEDNVSEIKSRYDAVFVDEYQDTNPIQEYIVNKVSKDERFYVGDLKQSIYGFRLCEPKIIKDRYEKYKKTGEGTVIDLNSNFRSNQAVINFVNDFFEIIMTEKSSLVDYKNTSMLEKGITVSEKIDESNDCKIVLFESDKKAEPKEFTGIYDVLKDEIIEKEDDSESEADYLINEINSLVGSYEIDGRKCRYSDIAILVQSKNIFLSLQNKLEKYVPLNLVDFEQNSSKQDIDTINSVLSLAINIKQDKPLAISLLGYFGNMSEQELAEVRIKYPNGRFYDAVLLYANEQKDSIAKKLQNFISLLESTKFNSSFKDVPQLFRNLVGSGFDNYISAQKDGAERLNNLNAYILKLSTDNKLYNIIDYLEYTKTNNNNPTTVSSKNKDAVTVMTIHKSKGLEFPIVFLPSLQHQFNYADTRQSFLYNSHIGAGIYYYDAKNYVKKETLARIAIKMQIESEQQMERIRLLYVALTRAKNKLYLLATASLDNAPYEISQCGNYFDMISYAISKNPSLNKYVQSAEASDISTISTPTFKLTKPDKKYIDIIKKALEFEYPHKEATTMLLKHSATSINKTRENDSYKIDDENTFAKVGIIYHKVMQYINFNCYTLEDVTSEIDSMVKDNILTIDERKLVSDEQIFKVLNLDIINIAGRNKNYREKEFVVKVDASKLGISTVSENIFVQGVIDLLVVGDKNYLVDYKFSGKSDEELVKTYEKQFYVYEMAYKTLFGANIDEKVLVNLKKGTQIIIK